MATSRFIGLPLASKGQRRVLARKAGTALFLSVLVNCLLCYGSANAGTQCGPEPGAANCGDTPVDLGSAPTPAGSRHYIGNPIDVITGNKYQPGYDFAAFASPLVRTRHYNTALAHQNIGYGAGWRDTYSLRLYKTSHGYQLIQSDGRAITFERSDEKPTQYATQYATDGILSTQGSITWQLPDGRTWTFVGSYPTQLALSDGTWLKLTYKDKRLHTVTDDLGDSLQYFYSAGPVGLKRYSNEANGTQPGHLRCVQLPDGSGVHYGYDAKSNLVSVQHRDGYNWEYGYEDERFEGFLTSARALEVVAIKNSKDWLGCFSPVSSSAGIKSEPYIFNNNQSVFSKWGYDQQGRAVSMSVPYDKFDLELNYGVGYTDIRKTDRGTDSSEVPLKSDRSVYYRFHWKIAEFGASNIQLKTCRTCSFQNLIPVLKRSWHGHTGVVRNYGEANGFPKSRVENTKSAFKGLANGKFQPRTGGTPSGNTRLYSNTDLYGLHDLACNNKKLSSQEIESEKELACSFAKHRVVALELQPQRQRPYKTRYGSSRFIPVHLFKPKHCPLPEGMTCADIDEAILFASLAACAYDPADCRTDWIQVDGKTLSIPGHLFELGAYRAVLLFNEARNEYVIAFKGTSLLSLKDWKTNVSNHLGLGDPIHYELAVELARRLVRSLEESNSTATLVFTGHSLGGGLASIAALATGDKATVFNTAAVSQNTLYENLIDLQADSSHIEVINTTGDVVSDFQNLTGSVAPGQHTYIGNPSALTSVNAHFLSSAQKELNKLNATYCNGASK